MLRVVDKEIILVLLLLCVPTAYAAPTTGNRNIELVISDISLSSDESYLLSPQAIHISEFTSLSLANMGEELLMPKRSAGIALTSAKSLPAVPAAIFMTLAGFLCVSLVKDRRIWLAALAGLLYIGHIGVNAVPELASCLCHEQQVSQSSSMKTIRLSDFQSCFRLRSETEGSQFIGLLHHLEGIPACTKSRLVNSNQRRDITTFGGKRKRCSYIHSLREQSSCSNFSYKTVLSEYRLNNVTHRLAFKAEHSIYISPKFTSNYLPHGPPGIV